jgi:hypothetical protein
MCCKKGFEYQTLFSTWDHVKKESGKVDNRKVGINLGNSYQKNEEFSADERHIKEHMRN